MLEFDSKDPADTDDFRVDLPVADGDTVSAVNSVTIKPTGQMTETVGSRVVDTTGIQMRMVGGRANVDYLVTINYTTAGGRIKERSVKVPVRDK